MPRLIALEWDHNEIRVAVAATRGHEVVIQHADAIALDATDSTPHGPDEIGKRIAARLNELKVPRADAIVTVGRAGIELRHLNVPPVPEDELPELVRFQALQQFTTLDDDWPLDFVFTDEADAPTRQILAAALPPQALRQITDTCDAAQLRPLGVILRPCGTASMVRRQVKFVPGQFVLVIDLLGDDADLTVLSDKSLLLTRTVRLPDHDGPAGRQQAILGETRRTLAVANTQLKTSRIEQVMLCDDSEMHRQLSAEIQRQLKLDVDFIAPFTGLLRSADLRNRPPANAERFKPLFGALVDELQQRQHAIDFLRPKRAVAPPSHWRLWTTVALVASLLVIGLVGSIWWRMSSQDREIADLRKETQKAKELVETAQKQQTYLNGIDEWYRKSPNWLVELRELSEKVPSANQLRLVELQADLTSGGGGTIMLKGYVDDSATVSDLETQLRGARHGIVGLDRDYMGDDPVYPWYFMERVVVRAVPSETVESGGEKSQSADAADGRKEASR